MRLKFLGCFVFLILIGLTTDTLAQEVDYLWTRQFGSPCSDYSQGIAIDRSGNIYIVGYTEGNLANNKNAGKVDIILVKYDSTGKMLFQKQFGTTESEQGIGIDCDFNGNIYITGHTYGKIEGNMNAGGADAFLLKYAPNGSLIWAKQFGSTESDYGMSVSCDRDGNIYVMGDTYGKMAGIRNVGDADIFLIKYSATGDKIWAIQFGTPYTEHGVGLTCDQDGNIYVVGDTCGKLSENNTYGNYDIFLAKYNPYGDQLWVKQFGTKENDFSGGIVFNGSDGIYITGETKGKINIGENVGSSDIFLAKYDLEGKRIWIKQIGTKKSESSLGIAIDNQGHILITGDTAGKLAMDVGTGHNDIFLVGYDKFGNRLWIKQFGAEENDFSAGIITEQNGNIYLTGYTEGRLNNNKNSGGSDLFLVKYRMKGVVLNEQEQVRIEVGEKGYLQLAKKEKAIFVINPKESQDLEINISSLQGTPIWKKKIAVQENRQEEITWDGKNSSGEFVIPGVYIVQIKGKGIDVKEKLAVVE